MDNKIKRAILEGFTVPETHPTENELYTIVTKQVDVNIKEFQQNLAELLNKKEIYSLKSSDKNIHYGKQKGPHYHFICDDCGKVRDFLIEEGAYNMIRDYIQKKIHSYGIIDEINLSVRGKCYDCQK